MSKTVRKFMQEDIWNIGRNESWFTDMAAKGFHLRRIGNVFATFEKGEPKKQNTGCILSILLQQRNNLNYIKSQDGNLSPI